jgi:hypothetical protein
MTAAELRALALALPGASEQPHFERSSFRVGKRIFATLTADGTQAMVIVQPRQKLYQLVEDHPGSFVTLGGWTVRLGALGVLLAAADPELVGELLEASWRRVAPKRAIAQRDGEMPGADEPKADKPKADKPKTNKPRGDKPRANKRKAAARPSRRPRRRS